MHPAQPSPIARDGNQIGNGETASPRLTRLSDTLGFGTVFRSAAPLAIKR